MAVSRIHCIVGTVFDRHHTPLGASVEGQVLGAGVLYFRARFVVIVGQLERLTCLTYAFAFPDLSLLVAVLDLWETPAPLFLVEHLVEIIRTSRTQDFVVFGQILSRTIRYLLLVINAVRTSLEWGLSTGTDLTSAFLPTGALDLVNAVLDLEQTLGFVGIDDISLVALEALGLQLD